MMGTFAGALAKLKIPTNGDNYRADVTGYIEDFGGVLKITKINVDYTLSVSEVKLPFVEEAFNSYLPSCPAAQSVIGCIDITHKLNLDKK